METSVRNVITGKGLSGLMKTVAALRVRVTKISSQTALPCEMFANGIPYEASRTYRTIKVEFEHNKSMAAIEAHRQAVRGC